MRRFFMAFLTLCLVLAGFAPRGDAAPQLLPELAYKLYPLRDVVFVDFHNPYFTPVGNITINMTIREGTGRNRIIAIGQTKMPANLILMPGEHTSARIPIRARVVRDIPGLAQVEFKIIATSVADTAVPPGIVVQDSVNGVTMELNRDANTVPYVMGFIGLDPAITEPTTAQVDMAILTFYDEDHQIVWSEYLPINGKVTNNDSLLVWGRYEQASSYVVPDISTVEVKFIAQKSN